jgi:hypothetical protein
MRDTIDMAREAGNDDLFDAMQVAFLERLVALVRADERSVEREACAKVCEEHQFASIGLAAAIRARGNT